MSKKDSTKKPKGSDIIASLGKNLKPLKNTPWPVAKKEKK